MAICDNCKSESSRIRSRWSDQGVRMPDECPQCSPQSFAEKFKSVRDGQVTMGHEYMPTMYRKTDAGFVPTDELLADTEAQVLKGMENSEANQAYAQAVEEKRQSRRTKPMDALDIEQAVTRWNNAAQA